MRTAIDNTEDARDLLALRFPALTSKQLGFCAAFVANGGKGTAAAKAAGYAPNSAHVEAYRQLQNPSIIKAIHELSVSALGALAPGAIKTIGKLSQIAVSEYVQLEASKDILTRLGMAAATKVRVSSDVSVTFDFGDGTREGVGGGN